MSEIQELKQDLAEVNLRPVITVREFMALLNVKSQTTFNKRALEIDFPEAIEWPPNSRTRGWRREEVDAYMQAKLDGATRWSDLPEQPLAGAAKDLQTARRA